MGKKNSICLPAMAAKMQATGARVSIKRTITPYGGSMRVRKEKRKKKRRWR
jgi:hypothetical protein